MLTFTWYNTRLERQSLRTHQIDLGPPIFRTVEAWADFWSDDSISVSYWLTSSQPRFDWPRASSGQQRFENPSCSERLQTHLTLKPRKINIEPCQNINFCTSSDDIFTVRFLKPYSCRTDVIRFVVYWSQNKHRYRKIKMNWGHACRDHDCNFTFNQSNSSIFYFGSKFKRSGQNSLTGTVR